MKTLSAVAASILLIFSASQASAEEITTRHSVGIQVGGGGLEYKGKDTDGQGVGQSYLYYNYQFAKGFYAEIGMIGAEDVDDWECLESAEGDLTCNTDDSNDFELESDNFDFGSIVVAVKGELNVSKRNSFYAKVGVEFYDYQFDLNREEVVDEDGTGFFVEGGWQYKWDSGVGVNVGIQSHDLGDLDMNSLLIGINYSF